VPQDEGGRDLLAPGSVEPVAQLRAVGWGQHRHQRRDRQDHRRAGQDQPAEALGREGQVGGRPPREEGQGEDEAAEHEEQQHRLASAPEQAGRRGGQQQHAQASAIGGVERRAVARQRHGGAGEHHEAVVDHDRKGREAAQRIERDDPPGRCGDARTCGMRSRRRVAARALGAARGGDAMVVVQYSASRPVCPWAAVGGGGNPDCGRQWARPIPRAHADECTDLQCIHAGRIRWRPVSAGCSLGDGSHGPDSSAAGAIGQGPIARAWHHGHAGAEVGASWPGRRAMPAGGRGVSGLA
jgi:hypothetical protein